MKQECCSQTRDMFHMLKVTHTHIHTYNCDFNVNIVIILFWNCFYYVHNQLPNLLYIVFIILIYYTLCLYFPYSKRMNVFSILIFISGSLCNDDNLLNRLKKLVYAVFVNFDEWKINECKINNCLKHQSFNQYQHFKKIIELQNY